MKKARIAIAAVLWIVSAAAGAQAREQILITGSSTVYPFVTTAGEYFRNKTAYRAPIVEPMGTGGGMKEFCGGIGPGYPDIANASRQIKRSETELCASHGITDIHELFIGYDGIVLAHSAKAAQFSISLKQLFLAMARQVPKNGKLVDNPYQKWSDVGSQLPDYPILVYGPPPTSGTRDAFVEKVMQEVCMELPEFHAAYPDKKERKGQCGLLREDGAFVDAGENDNIVIQKIQSNDQAFGIVGFGFMEENYQLVRGSLIDGVAPTFESIQDKSYPVWRTMYVYIKGAHVGMVPGIAEFLNELFSDEAMDAEEGYLVLKGLVPPNAEELSGVRAKVREFSGKTGREQMLAH